MLQHGSLESMPSPEPSPTGRGRKRPSLSAGKILRARATSALFRYAYMHLLIRCRICYKFHSSPEDVVLFVAVDMLQGIAMADGQDGLVLRPTASGGCVTARCSIPLVYASQAPCGEMASIYRSIAFVCYHVHLGPRYASTSCQLFLPWPPSTTYGALERLSLAALSGCARTWIWIWIRTRIWTWI